MLFFHLAPAGALAALLASAQLPGAPGTSTVKGEIKGLDRDGCAHLVVRIRADQATEASSNTNAGIVGPDCEFEIRDAPTGSQTLMVFESRSGDPIQQTTIRVGRGEAPVEVWIAPRRGEQPVSGVVSVRVLSHKPPKRALKLFNDAQTFARKNQPMQAIEKLREAVAIDPEFAQAFGNLGTLYARANRIEEALQASQQAKRAGLDSSALETNIAWALAALHRAPEALIAARRAVTLDPQSARAHYMLGYTLAALDANSTEALTHLTTASAEIPAAVLMTARVLAARGNLAAARGKLQEYSKVCVESDQPVVRNFMAQLDAAAPQHSFR